MIKILHITAKASGICGNCEDVFFDGNGFSCVQGRTLKYKAMEDSKVLNQHYHIQPEQNPKVCLFKNVK